MSDAHANHCGCPTPVVTDVPGADGVSVFTFTTGDTTIVQAGFNAAIPVVSNVMFVPGQCVILYNAAVGYAHFRIASLTGTNLIVGTCLGVAGDAPKTTVFPSGSQVTADGSPGQGAYTTVVGNPTIAAGSNTVDVASTSWMAIGQVVIISNSTNFCHLIVTAINNSTEFVGTYLGYSGDSTGVRNSGDRVSVSGQSFSIGALPAALVNTDTFSSNSGTLVLSEAEFLITIPVTTLSLGTVAITLMNAYTPGFRFAVLQFDFINTSVGAGAGASETFSLAISGTNVTGGVVNTTLASTNTSVGRITAGTAITALNIGGAADTLTINMAAGGTNFTAATGAGYFLIRIKNIDTANALASLASAVNTLIAAL